MIQDLFKKTKKIFMPKKIVAGLAISLFALASVGCAGRSGPLVDSSWTTGDQIEAAQRQAYRSSSRDDGFIVHHSADDPRAPNLLHEVLRRVRGGNVYSGDHFEVEGGFEGNLSDGLRYHKRRGSPFHFR